MGAISTCRLLGEEDLIQISKIIINGQIKKGITDPNLMIKDFWNRLMKSGHSYESALASIGSYLRFLPTLISKYKGSGDQAKIDLMEGLGADAFFNFVKQMDLVIDNTSDPISTIEKLDSYIQSTFVVPVLGPKTEIADDSDSGKKEILKEVSEEDLEEEPDLLFEEDIEESKTESEEYSNHVVNSPVGLRYIASKMAKQSYIAIEKLGSIIAFHYDPSTQTFQEISADLQRNDIEGNELSVEDFMDQYLGSPFVTLPSIVESSRQDKESRNSNLREYYGRVIQRFKDSKSIVTFFGNAIKSKSRELSLFSFDKNGKFKLGELASELKSKNDIFHKLFKKLNSSAGANGIVLDAVTLKSYFGAGAGLFVELNDDESLETKQIILTVKKNGKDVMVLGNVFDLEQGNAKIFNDVQGGSDYAKFLKGLIEDVNKSESKSVNVTELGIKLNQVFLPGQKTGEANRIYANDKDRFGKNSDVQKAQNLTLRDGIILLEGMGYAVSDVMIDKNISNSSRHGGSYIAVSPFRSKADINLILKNAFGKAGSDEAFTMEELSKKHNISFIFLDRKKLKFSDYIKLTQNNVTVNKMEDVDGSLKRDYTKKQSIFNVGQSALIHFRMSKSIAYLEEALAKNPSDTILARNILLLKIYLFNNQDYYTTDPKKLKDLEAFREVFKKLYTDKELVLTHEIVNTAEANYQAWLGLDGQKSKKTGKNQQMNKSKEFASKLFGYFPSTKSNDPFDQQLTEKKDAYAAWASKDDAKMYNNAKRKGGIFGSIMLLALRDMDKHKNISLNGRTLEQEFDNESYFEGDIEITGEFNAMTFNPVVANSESEGAIRGNDSSSAMGLRTEIDGENLLVDYLELPYLPLMPHLYIEAKGILKDNNAPTAPTPATKNQGRPRGSRDVHGSNASKTISDSSLIETSEYQLSEEEAVELYESILGEVQGQLEIMDSPIKMADGIVVGQVGKNILKLLQVNGKLSERVLRHEAMHRIINEVLSPESRARVYRAAKKYMLKLNPEMGSIQQITDQDADEFIAENYEANHKSYNSKFVKNLPKILKDFYFLIRAIYGRLSGKLNYMDIIAERANAGMYVNAELNQNAYLNNVANKKIYFDSKKLAGKFNTDRTLGVQLMENSISVLIQDVQDLMFGNQVAQGMMDQSVGSSYDYSKLKSFREGLEEVKSNMLWVVSEILRIGDDKEVIDELSLEERALFIPENQEFYVFDDLVKIADNLNELNYNSLSPNGQLLVERITSLRNFEAIAKNAIPFVDLSSGKDMNESGIEAHEDEIQKEGEANNLVGDKLRNSFERSEISAYGTFTEKVKFFLYNTKQFDSRYLVNRKHVDNYFALVINRVMEQTTNATGFDLNTFLEVAKNELDKLDPNKTGNQNYSDVYRSVRGIYDKFFSVDENSGYSFLRISLLEGAGFEAQAIAHAEVLAAIISAQKSVVQQNFLKIDRDSLSETKGSAAKDVKNSIKDSTVFTLFKKSKTNNKLTYKLSAFAVNRLVKGGNYKLGNHAKGLSITVGQNTVVIDQNDLKTSASKWDFSKIGEEKLLSLFPENSTLLTALNDLGFGLTAEFFESIISKDSSSNLNKKRLAALFFHSQIVVNRQYIEEKKSKEFNGPALSIIEKLSSKRNENIHKLINESKRKDMLSPNFKEGENTEDLTEGSEHNVFSPTSMYESIEKLVASSSLTSYEKKDTTVFLLDGNKEVVDKYPTTLHRVMGKWKNFQIKIQHEYDELVENNLMITDADGSPIPLETYLRKKFRGIYSGVYQNPMVKGLMNHDGILYYKGSKNNKTNRSRSFTEATETETFMDVLKFMIGSGFKESYYHAKEIQADRGFLVLLKLVSTAGRNVRFFGANTKKDGFKPDQTALAELENIRRIPFHHALNSMIEAYQILGQTNKVAALNQALNSGVFDEKLIREEFDQYDLYLQKLQESENSQLIFDTLADRKHYVKVGGKFIAPPLLKAKMKMDGTTFISDFEAKFLEFAEYAKSHLRNINAPMDGKVYLKQSDLSDIVSLNDKRFENNGLISWFTAENLDDSKYEKMSTNEKIKSFHPALYSIFMTYYINQTHISQSTTGDAYLYKGDKSTDPSLEHTYMTDLVKRQGTFTTPKIEGMYRETIEINGKMKVVNRRALGEKVNIAVFADSVFNADNESKEFAESFRRANNISEDKAIEQESTDGYIGMNAISQSLMEASFGGNIGMSVGSMSKFNLHSFNPENGDLMLPKGLAHVLTGEFLSMSTPFMKGMLKAMYSTASIQMEDGSVKNLWDIYEGLLQEFKEDPAVADAEIVEMYHMARNNEGGLALIGDIVHFMPAASTNKAGTKGMNRINSDGVNQFDQTQYTSHGLDGFGIILDLQKDIDKKKNEVSLSTQMLFLAGINGDNYKKAFTLYSKIAQMSSKKIDEIASDIAQIFDKNQVNNKGIMENKEAVRKWMLKEIKNAFETKSDFGLIYQLVEDINGAAISNPLLYEEIFQKVGSRFSEAIKMKMNGFKSVHAPAHDIIKLYKVPSVDINGNITSKWVTRKDALSLGVNPEDLISRNARYSFKKQDSSSLTDSEIFTGNVFVGKYKISSGFSINDIFTLSVDGKKINVEANDHWELSVNHKVRFKGLIDQMKSGASIDWINSPIVLAMINTKKINDRMIDKLKRNESLTGSENEYLLKAYMDMAKEMNEQLYGIITRIPSTGKNSSTPFRIKGFVQGYKNASFLPSEWFKISGADNDGDTVQLWHYGSGNDLETEALNTMRSIMKDVANEEEIFGEINLDYFTNLSSDKKIKMLANSKGFTHGSLKTMVQMKANNSVGVEQTGINATQSKVHSYALVARRVLNEVFAGLSVKENPQIAGIGQKDVSVFYTVNKDGKTVAINSGALSLDAKGDSKDSEGNFLYKWAEMLTNGAIDNAKHLFMDATNINRYNSSIQQAMAFFGFPKETIVNMLVNENLVKVFDTMKAKDNIANDTIPRLEKVMLSTKFHGETTGAVALSQFIVLSEEGEFKGSVKVSITKIKDHFKAKNWVIDFNNLTDLLAFTLLMNDASDEINLIRKIITVTDDIGGKSTKQELSVENILEAANHKSNDKFLTAKSLKAFLESNSGLSFTTATSAANQVWHRNPYTVNKVISGEKNSYFVHPLALMMALPHVREFAIAHLTFNETKATHLIEETSLSTLRKEALNGMERKNKRVELNRNKVTKSMYKLINAKFLKDRVKQFIFQGKEYNFGSVKDVYEFRNDFANFILTEKTNTDNLFIRRLTVAPGSISFPSSEKMDSKMRQMPTAEFRRLPEDVKRAFFMFEITSGDTQLQYKKGSFAPFMEAESFKEYNQWMRSQELSQSIITDSVQARAFLRTFAYENPSLQKRIWDFQTNLASPDGNSKIISDSNNRKAPGRILLKAKQVRDFDLGMFNEGSINEALPLQAKLEALEKDLRVLEEAERTIRFNPSEHSKSDLFKAKMYINGAKSKIADVNRELDQVLMKDVSTKGVNRFRVVRGYDKGTKSFTSRLYELRPMTAEELEKSPKRKEGKESVPQFEVIMEEVFLPFDTDISLYLLGDSIPKVTENSRIFESTEKLLVANQKASLQEGTYFTQEFEKVEIVSGQDPQVKKFSFRDTQGSISSRNKIEAVIRLIQRVFPNIKVELVSNLSGIRGKAAGFVHQNTVYLNMDNIGMDTPIHEFGHILVDLIQMNNPVLFKTIERLVTKTALFGRIEKKYAEFGNSHADNVKETFVTMLGSFFERNESDFMEDLNNSDKNALIKAFKEVQGFIKSIIRDMLSALNIRKQYINENLIEKLNVASELDDMFKAISGAVAQGEIITSMSTQELNEIEESFGFKGKRASQKEVDAVILELMEKGIITNNC